MADFGFVKDQGVKGDAIARFTMYGITMPDGANPVLIGRYAGEANRPYYNEMLKRQMKTVSAKQAAFKAGAVNPEMIGETRDMDRELFPKFVLTGWENVTDGSGKAVKFNADDCRGFLEALDNEDFDDVRNFFGNRVNFKGNTPSTDEAITEGNA